MVEKRYLCELFHWIGMDDIKEVSKILLTNPEFINEQNGVNDNSLMIASRLGHLELVKYLIENTDININHFGSEGNALLISLKYNRPNISEYLIKHTDIDIKNTCEHGKNALNYAAIIGNEDLIELLLEYSCDINNLDKFNNNILFDLITNYSENHYLSFEAIQENMNHDILFISNNDKQNIFSLMDFLIEDANNIFLKQLRIKNFSLLHNILNQKKASLINL